MPYNLVGKHYDLRPYVDQFGWLVINRSPNTVRFKMIKGKLKWSNEGYYHIDRYDLEMMKRQARKLIPILVDTDLKQGCFDFK